MILQGFIAELQIEPHSAWEGETKRFQGSSIVALPFRCVTLAQSKQLYMLHLQSIPIINQMYSLLASSYLISKISTYNISTQFAYFYISCMWILFIIRSRFPASMIRIFHPFPRRNTWSTGRSAGSPGLASWCRAQWCRAQKHLEKSAQQGVTFTFTRSALDSLLVLYIVINIIYIYIYILCLLYGFHT